MPLHPAARPSRTAQRHGDEPADDGRPARARQSIPATGLPVQLRKGPYGIYVQLGGPASNGEKPSAPRCPRASTPADVDLDTALKLLSLPREIGPHPEDGEMIIAGIGRFGPYIKHGKIYKSLGRRRRRADHRPQPRRGLLAEPRKVRRGAPEPHQGAGRPSRPMAGR